MVTLKNYNATSEDFAQKYITKDSQERVFFDSAKCIQDAMSKIPSNVNHGGSFPPGFSCFLGYHSHTYRLDATYIQLSFGVYELRVNIEEKTETRNTLPLARIGTTNGATIIQEVFAASANGNNIEVRIYFESETKKTPIGSYERSLSYREDNPVRLMGYTYISLINIDLRIATPIFIQDNPLPPPSIEVFPKPSSPPPPPPPPVCDVKIGIDESINEEGYFCMSFEEYERFKQNNKRAQENLDVTINVLQGLN